MDWDDAYANAAHIPNADGFVSGWERDAAAFRTHMVGEGRATLGVSYGDTARQAYDVFEPEGVAKGTLVFVHGGYWLRFDRSYWSHFATGALMRGWRVVMPSYDLCPDVRIADITSQIAKAMTQIASSFAGPLSLAGHSAGGHLVARMGQVLPHDILTRVQHIVPISPVSDLRPMLNLSMNADFKLTEDTAIAESPALHPAPNVPVTCWVGADERPVFLDQSRWLAEAWGCDEVVVEGKHHFDVIDELADGDSRMIETLLG